MRRRAKGIIAKPMPKYWYSKYGISERTELERNIVAPCKPYFMKYVYPHLKREYDTYIKENNYNVIHRFCKYGIYSIDELIAYENKTDEMKEFVEWYERKKVVSDNDCVVNRICYLFENLYPSYSKLKIKPGYFDYTILKSDNEYSQQSYAKIKELYNEYSKKRKSFVVDMNTSSKFFFDAIDEMKEVYYKEEEQNETEIELFRKKCLEVCSSEDELCNIVLDICYNNEHSKQFAWEMCGNKIIENLLKRNDYKISFPVVGGNDFEYAGVKFGMKTMEVKL